MGKGKNSPPTYAENIDFLVGSNPVQGVLQCWKDTNTKYSLMFKRWRTTLPTWPNGTRTIPDSNFYMLIAVTVDVNISKTFNDYGGPGTISYSGISEYPLWNCAQHGPDLANASAVRWYPYTFKWTPNDGAVVTFPTIQTFDYTGGMPNATGAASIYYAAVPGFSVPGHDTNKSKSSHGPLQMLNLVFEPQLGSGPEYDASVGGNPAQRIIYPYYAGCGSPQFNLGTGGVLPPTRLEVLGGFNVYSSGDADFADMIEDIVKSGMIQVGTQIGEIQRGVNCLELPGAVQKNFYYNLEPMDPTLAYYQPNRPGSILIAFCRWRAQGTSAIPPTISDTAGNTWNVIAADATDPVYGMWYASAVAATNNRVHFVSQLTLPYDAEAYLMEFDPATDTVDAIATAQDNSNTAAAFITVSAPCTIVCLLNGHVTGLPPHWSKLFPGTNEAQVLYRTVATAGTYEISIPIWWPSNSWQLALIALKQSQPAGYAKPLGNIIDDVTMQKVRNQCRAYGLYGSLSMQSQKKAQEWLADLYYSCNAAPVWSGFRLKSIPRAEASAVGNGAVYIAPTAAGPVANLNENDFLGDESTPPVTIERQARVDAPNIQQLQIINRAAEYAPAVVSQPESATIALYGPRKDSPKVHNEIQDVLIARKLLGIETRRASYLRNIYKFKLTAKWQLLEAMDLVTLTEPLLGLDHVPVRLTSVEEDEEFNLSCEAEPFFYGVHVPDAAMLATPNEPYVPPLGAQPASVNAPIIFEPVMRLSHMENQSQLWLLVSDHDYNYGGCVVSLSTDGGSTYKQIGNIQGSATTGVLTATWPAAADPDTTNDLTLDLSESLGSLDSYSVDEEDNFVYPCYVEGGAGSLPYELMTYASAQLTAEYQYTLQATGGNKLRRAVFGVPTVGNGVSHSNGARWAFLGPPEMQTVQGMLKIPLDPKLIGKTLYFKFQAYNHFGGGLQNLADATAYSYVPQGVGAENFLINGA